MKTTTCTVSVAMITVLHNEDNYVHGQCGNDYCVTQWRQLRARSVWQWLLCYTMKTTTCTVSVAMITVLHNEDNYVHGQCGNDYCVTQWRQLRARSVWQWLLCYTMKTAWCSEIGSLQSLDVPELHASVASENQFHCTRLHLHGQYSNDYCVTQWRQLLARGQRHFEYTCSMQQDHSDKEDVPSGGLKPSPSCIQVDNNCSRKGLVFCTKNNQPDFG